MKKSVFILLLNLPFLLFSQQNSVLSSGNWYKISVEKTGIHKISYSDLANYGIAVDEIDPQSISLYGNTAGMLSESYDDPFYTDLQEISIEVIGEEDGSFQPADYILFYGQGPNIWDYNSTSKRFNHVVNWYSSSTSYFLNIGNGSGKRIPLITGTEEAHNKTIDTLNLLLYHENELTNPGKSGKVWLGETFENTDPLTIEFDLTGYEVYQNDHFLKTKVAAKSTVESNFVLKKNNIALKSMAISPLFSFFNIYKDNTIDTVFSITESELAFSYNYSFPNDSSIGWLDYLELNLKIAPKFQASQMGFRSAQNIGAGNISYYYLNYNAPENLVIWNVSDPVNIENIALNIETDKVWFKLENDHLLEFQAFDGLNFFTPTFLGKVENQNLHAAKVPELLIITAPEFLGQANQLAAFHEVEDGMSTGVFTNYQIYNEFSSGSQDITALRNFIWYMKDQSVEENLPKYVLLFGDASYDYKNITENNTNFVPTYTTLESANAITSFASDRYFSIKNLNNPGDEQAAIGRIPIATAQEADDALQKIQNYASNQSLGSWKNEMMFIGDDADNGLHQRQVEDHISTANDNNPEMNIHKTYLDFFELVETEEGLRYPEVNMEILNKVNEGVYYANYVGHGGSVQLAAERILAKDDLLDWTNNDKLTLWVITSADVANYTNPEFVSLGEAFFLKENAGAIGVLSSSGINYASANMSFNTRIIEKLTDKSLQDSMRFGDLLPNLNSYSHNDLKWIFLGDPALKIRFPEFDVVSININDKPIDDYNDTISPGSILTIQGEIRSKQDGSLQLDFDGTVYLKVLAPVYLRSTMGNQGTPVEEFEVQDSILTISEAEVEYGSFEIQFALPNNEYNDFGKIKLSWYAENGISDANGFFNGLTYGGQPNGIADNNNLLDQIKVYPTFFDDHIYIEMPVSLSDGLKYRVFGTMGNMVYENSTTRGTAMEKINLFDLAEGMYIINISSDENSKNFKLLKN
jgi:hypothetical protein